MFLVLLLMLVLTFISEPAITFPLWVWFVVVIIFTARVVYAILFGDSK